MPVFLFVVGVTFIPMSAYIYFHNAKAMQNKKRWSSGSERFIDYRVTQEAIDRELSKRTVENGTVEFAKDESRFALILAQ